MEQPKPNDDQVLIEIHAFSINPMDIAGRMGMLQAPFNDLWSFPLELGWDLSGVVAEVGKNVTEYQVGDKVFGGVPSAHAANNGTYGEFAVADQTKIAHMPEGPSFDQAAALPIGGMTAYKAIAENLAVQPGQKVLIQGGAGGVGLIAVQIAKNIGAYVAATASPSHTKLLEDLGVDQVIDYNTTSAADILHDYDAVFDTVGDIQTGLKVLKSDGKLITIAAQDPSAIKPDQQKTAEFQFTNGGTKELDALGKLVVDGKLKLEITEMPFSVENVVKAHEMIQGRHTTGKIVIDVK